MTKLQDMKAQMRQQTAELHRLKIIMHVLVNGSDKDAAEVLARLRLGETVEQLASVLEARLSDE